MCKWKNVKMGSELLGKLCSSGKLDQCKFTIAYINYTWNTKHINWICTCFSLMWYWCGCLYGSSFSSGSSCKQSKMGPKFKQITVWNQSSKYKLVWCSKTEIRGYCQFQVDHFVFYRKDSVILTYVDYCVIVY